MIPTWAEWATQAVVYLQQYYEETELHGDIDPESIRKLIDAYDVIYWDGVLGGMNLTHNKEKQNEDIH